MEMLFAPDDISNHEPLKVVPFATDLITLQRGPGLVPCAVGVPTTFIEKVCAFDESAHVPLAVPALYMSAFPIVLFKNKVWNKDVSVKKASEVAPEDGGDQLAVMALSKEPPAVFVMSMLNCACDILENKMKHMTRDNFFIFIRVIKFMIKLNIYTTIFHDCAIDVKYFLHNYAQY
jgi:hypothetical protein